MKTFACGDGCPPVSILNATELHIPRERIL